MRALTELDREGLVRVEGEQVWFNETANLQHMIGLPPERRGSRLIRWLKNVSIRGYAIIVAVAAVVVFCVVLMTDLFSQKAVCPYIATSLHQYFEKCHNFVSPFVP